MKNTEVEDLVLKLKKELQTCSRNNEQLKEQLFSFKSILSNDLLAAFYTVFPINNQTMIAL